MTTLAKKQMRTKSQKPTSRAEREGLDPKVLGEYERAPAGGNSSFRFLQGMMEAVHGTKDSFAGAKAKGKAEAAARDLPGPLPFAGKLKGTRATEGTVRPEVFDAPIREDWLTAEAPRPPMPSPTPLDNMASTFFPSGKKKNKAFSDE